MLARGLGSTANVPRTRLAGLGGRHGRQDFQRRKAGNEGVTAKRARGPARDIVAADGHVCSSGISCSRRQVATSERGRRLARTREQDAYRS